MRGVAIEVDRELDRGSRRARCRQRECDPFIEPSIWPSRTSIGPAALRSSRPRRAAIWNAAAHEADCFLRAQAAAEDAGGAEPRAQRAAELMAAPEQYLRRAWRLIPPSGASHFHPPLYASERLCARLAVEMLCVLEFASQKTLLECTRPTGSRSNSLRIDTRR